jgi:hypothetical protein
VYKDGPIANKAESINRMSSAEPTLLLNSLQLAEEEAREEAADLAEADRHHAALPVDAAAPRDPRPVAAAAPIDVDAPPARPDDDGKLDSVAGAAGGDASEAAAAAAAEAHAYDVYTAAAAAAAAAEAASDPPPDWSPHDPASCEGYFGNGFSEAYRLVGSKASEAAGAAAAAKVGTNDGALLACHMHPATKATYCKAGSSGPQGGLLRMWPGRITMARGGEPWTPAASTPGAF